MTHQFEQQIEVLERFHKQAIKLSDKKFDPLHNQNIKISFMAEANAFGNVKSELPDANLLKIFLMEFRFFYIKDKNPYNFKRVCKFFIKNDFEKEKTREWLDVYNYIFSDESMKLRVGNKQLTTKIIFETILNAEHFHQEGSQKGVELIKLSPFVEPMARMKFFNVIRKLKIIICSFDKQIVEKYLEIH